MDSIFGYFESAAKNHITFGTVFTIVIILMIAIGSFVAVVIVSRVLRNKVSADDIRRKHLYITIFRIVKILIVVVTIFAVLQTLGVNLSVFGIGMGLILLLAVFSVKDSLKDFFSGLIIMTDKFFTVGDAVEYEGQEGIVISFSIRTTKIEMLKDRSVVTVLNRNITEMKKLSHMVDIDVPLSYELTQKEAFDLLTPVCEKIGQLDGVEKCELKGTQDFDTSAVNYRIRFFCEPKRRGDIRRGALMTIQKALDDAGIHIPYQQIDVHGVK